MTTSTSTAEPNPIAATLPLVIGVTGHRDLRLEDIPQLESAVAAVLASLRDKYPGTPLYLLSPLAAGADQLVARIALQHSVRLIVPLPLPQAEYEKDFSDPAVRQEFHRLLAQAQAQDVFELPLVAGNTPENIRAYGPPRDKQYAQVGAYIVRHSQIFLALWDGTETGLEGGTAQIVRFKLAGIEAPYAPSRNPLDVIDTGPVYHLLTPRQKNPPPQGELFSLALKFPPDGSDGGDETQQRQRHDRILQHMHIFNQDVQALSTQLVAQITQSKEYVIPAEKRSELPSTAATILEQYALADTLALHFQRQRRGTLIGLFVIAVLAVVSFEVYAHLFTSPLVLLLYLVTLGIAYLLYWIATRHDYQNKHLDYRALAEGLRVQLFWHLAGLPDEVAEHYLRQHRNELEWIRNAIRAWNVPAVNACAQGAATNAATTSPDCRQMLQHLVLKHWVEDQQGFFSRATARDHHKLHRHERTVDCLFISGLLLAALVVVLDFALPHSEAYSHWHHWLIVVMGTAPAMAAAMGGYAEKMAFAPQERRYRWMSDLFTRAQKKLPELLRENRLHDAQQLILDLGKEALEENGDWVLLHRERTPDYRKN
jgi:hypothetical protein